MSKNEEDHIADLKETFANLREAGLKLNPGKCVFGVSRGKMLRYMIGPKGIRANPEKTCYNLNGGAINQKGSAKTH